MDYIGIDIGSTASKVVVKGDHDIHFVLPTGWSSKETCQTIKDRLLEDSVDVLSDDSKVVATGYGRVAVDFADHVITEITCHARGGAANIQECLGVDKARAPEMNVPLSMSADRIPRSSWCPAAWYRTSR